MRRQQSREEWICEVARPFWATRPLRQLFKELGWARPLNVNLNVVCVVGTVVSQHKRNAQAPCDLAKHGIRFTKVLGVRIDVFLRAPRPKLLHFVLNTPLNAILISRLYRANPEFSTFS